MCNEHRRTVELGRISDAFAQLRIPLRFPEGAPNLAALESIRITDPTAIVRLRGRAISSSSSGAGAGRGRAASRCSTIAARAASSATREPAAAA